MANWCKTDPALAFKKKGIYYIKLHELAKRPGLDLEAVRKLGESRWVRAVDAAKQYGIPERTLRHQCNQTPGLARRIGKNWYLNLDQWKCGT